jgi:quinol monooxygenase YgiN
VFFEDVANGSLLRAIRDQERGRESFAMVKHIVMWRLRGEGIEKQDAAQLVKQSFEALSNKIPGLLKLEIGVDCSEIDYACDVVLYSEFADRAALAEYAKHPEHERVKALLGDSRKERYQVDYIV